MYSSEDLERFYFQHKTEALLTREPFSRQPTNYIEDMAADEKDRYIQYLIGRLNESELDRRAMELGVEEFQTTFDSVNASLAEPCNEMEELKGELRDEVARSKKAEARARKLDQQLKFVQGNKSDDKPILL